MAKEVKIAAPPPSMPPLPPTAHHTEPATEPAQVQAEPVPLTELNGMQVEAHPVGTAQYIAELEAENAEALKKVEAVAGRSTEGFKTIATQAITHAAAMAGHLPQDINLIPGTDAINAAAQQ